MKKIIILAISLSIMGCSSMAQKGAISLAYSNYNARDYRDTLKYISQAENELQPSVELKAELTYLKAQTYEKMGDYNRAKSLYQYLKNEHKSSQYGYLASQRLAQGI